MATIYLRGCGVPEYPIFKETSPGIFEYPEGTVNASYIPDELRHALLSADACQDAKTIARSTLKVCMFISGDHSRFVLGDLEKSLRKCGFNKYKTPYLFELAKAYKLKYKKKTACNLDMDDSFLYCLALDYCKVFSTAIGIAQSLSRILDAPSPPRIYTHSLKDAIRLIESYSIKLLVAKDVKDTLLHFKLDDCAKAYEEYKEAEKWRRAAKGFVFYSPNFERQISFGAQILLNIYRGEMTC